jgi:hypothetical protein
VSDLSGISVSNAGDVNGDGLDDLIVLFCLPNTIYDLPAFNLLFGSAHQADPINKSNAGKSYVVFGKQDNTAINLSAIVAHDIRFTCV